MSARLGPFTHSARGRAHPRRKRAAFTLVEVMVSLGVMMIGAMAIIGLQQHSIRANNHARQLETALQIAQTWIERLKQDAHTWNAAGIVGGTPSPVVVLASTRYLNRVNTLPDVFQIIPAANATVDASNGFDFRGADLNLSLTAQAANLHYCASFRPSWVIIGRALRVDVRVWWPREGTSTDMAAFITNTCADNDTDLGPPANLADTTAPFYRYHIVYLSTVIGHTRVER